MSTCSVIFTISVIFCQAVFMVLYDILYSMFLCYTQWFLATLSYQEALALTSPAAVNILSSSSGMNHFCFMCEI